MTDVVCDLDGVIYRGDTQIPGAAEGLQQLLSAGVNLLFVTNNSTRTPKDVAEKIRAVTGIQTEAGQVVTSSQAAASKSMPKFRLAASKFMILRIRSASTWEKFKTLHLSEL